MKQLLDALRLPSLTTLCLYAATLVAEVPVLITRLILTFFAAALVLFIKTGSPAGAEGIAELAWIPRRVRAAVTNPFWGPYGANASTSQTKHVANLGQREELAGFLEIHALINDHPVPHHTHSLRRAHISIALLANNFDVKWVVSQVGHADPKMTWTSTHNSSSAPSATTAGASTASPAKHATSTPSPSRHRRAMKRY
jgi:hypothetical protein